MKAKWNNTKLPSRPTIFTGAGVILLASLATVLWRDHDSGTPPRTPPTGNSMSVAPPLLSGAGTPEAPAHGTPALQDRPHPDKKSPPFPASGNPVSAQAGTRPEASALSGKRPAANVLEPETSVPSFRPMPPRPRQSGGEPEPVTLEFSGNAAYPAVLADMPAEDLSGGETSPRQTAAARQIAGEFVNAVNEPGSSFPDSANNPGQNAGAAETNADQNWDDAAFRADEQYRALIGHDAFMRQSLQAALLKRQLPAPSADP